MKFIVRTPLLLGFLAVIAGCSASPEGASEVSNEVTQSLRKRGLLLCDNPLPIPGDPYSFQLQRCAGRYAYLDTVRLPGGINDVMDADGERVFTIGSAETAQAKDHLFAEKVKRRVLSMFRGAEAQENLDAMFKRIEGRQVTTLRMPGVVASALDKGRHDLTMIVPQAAVRIAPYVSIISSGGSSIHLSDDAHFINVGYARGHNVTKDIRSGRSFGVTATRGALDASDVDYLDGIETILKTEEADAYQLAIMRFLVASDPRPITELSSEAQTVAVDFTAVYTAELDRHLMVNLDPKRHAWQRDLVEATWLSAYVTRSGKLFRDGKLVDGRPRDFFKQGTSGGGIGKTLRDRRLLSGAISQYMWQQEDTQAIARLAKAINAAKGSDVFHELGLLLINADMTSHVIAHAEEIAQATADFLSAVAAEADGITRAIASPSP